MLLTSRTVKLYVQNFELWPIGKHAARNTPRSENVRICDVLCGARQARRRDLNLGHREDGARDGCGRRDGNLRHVTCDTEVELCEARQETIPVLQSASHAMGD